MVIGVRVVIPPSTLRRVRGFRQGLGRRKLLAAIGNRQVAWIDKNFRDQGTEGRWAPLKPATIARKGSSLILQDEGRLKASFVPTHPRSAFRIGVNAVTVGTNVVYAATHEHGDPERGIPQRKMLPSRRTARRLAIETVNAVVKLTRARNR